jgi:hypothetical protein
MKHVLVPVALALPEFESIAGWAACGDIPGIKRRSGPGVRRRKHRSMGWIGARITSPASPGLDEVARMPDRLVRRTVVLAPCRTALLPPHYG